MYDNYIMQMLRTQISLPPDLRLQIDEDRRRRRETLSEYVRKATRARLRKTDRKKIKLDRLLDSVIGSVDLSKHPEWDSRKKVMNWQREIRREKEI